MNFFSASFNEEMWKKWFEFCVFSANWMFLPEERII